MAALQESETYESEIYQLERNDPVLGGVTGLSNKPNKQLANRTKWLKRKTELLNDAINYSATVLQAAIQDIKDNGAFVQVGSVLFVAGNIVPRGYVRMNGALLSRSAYPALWAYAQNAIASGNDTYSYPGLFGLGDNATTFQLPDTRGWFPRFWSDGGSGIDGNPLRAVGSREMDQVGQHTHPVTASNVVYQSSNMGKLDGMEENVDNTAGFRLNPVTRTETNLDPTGLVETLVKNVALLGVIKY